MSKSFSTIEYINGAMEAGFTRQQAEFQANFTETLVNNELVTKSFLSQELRKLEDKLTIRLGAMMFACSGLVITVLGFILKN